MSTIIVTETMVLPTGMAPSHHSAQGWPPRRNLRHYWWPDRESALVAALVEVDLVKVNGRTFSEWETR